MAAIWFQGDGVYNAVGGDRADPGIEDLASAWVEAAHAADCELLLCSSACARRLPGEAMYTLGAPYRVAGLGELFELMERTDRWVSL
jgi:sulfur relay (sulfurtransferase) complex TusBCD TusD component (DsrE family)